jgi:hypothetical protein
VRLREEELTGAFAPLRDARRFDQVFNDLGAVAWPGEIDLAPGAMYADVARGRNGAQPDRSGIDGECEGTSR